MSNFDKTTKQLLPPYIGVDPHLHKQMFSVPPRT